jgi:hypothetical protein
LTEERPRNQKEDNASRERKNKKLMVRTLGFRVSHLKFVNIEIMDSNAFMLTKFPHISIWVCFWGERNDCLQMQSPHESEILNRRICTSVVHQTPQKFGKKFS